MPAMSHGAGKSRPWSVRRADGFGGYFLRVAGRGQM